MSRTSLFWAVCVLAASFSGAASAQGSSAAASADDRFIYEQVDEGILRLDSRTGDVSLCSRQEGTGWTCRIVADERRAIDGEIGRLERENAELRKLLAAGGLNPPGSAAPSASVPEPKSAETPAGPAKAPEKTLSEKPAGEKPAEKKAITAYFDLSRTMDVAETVWRRLVEMMANVKSDLRKPG